MGPGLGQAQPSRDVLRGGLGSQFDAHDYDDVLPRQLRATIATPADLSAIGVLTPTDNAALAKQLAAARLVRATVPDVPVTETVFSPLSVLLQLAGLPLYAGATLTHRTTPPRLLAGSWGEAT